jgi:hypothetical protein
MVVLPTAASAQTTYSVHGANFKVFRNTSDCMLAGTTGDGVLLVGIDPNSGEVGIAMAPNSDPGIVDGADYPLTIIVGGNSYTWAGKGMTFSGSKIVAALSTDMRGVLLTLYGAQDIHIDVGETHIGRVNFDANFRAALANTVKCAQTL